jgi:hypothetical protein
MSIVKARAARKLKEEQKLGQDRDWDELCRRIHSGHVIPIISNAVSIDPIFDINNDQVLGINKEDEELRGRSIQEQLAYCWAHEIKHPLKDEELTYDRYRMPTVALFDRVVRSKDDRAAKLSYLKWLKEMLLFLAEDDERIEPETIEELKDDLKYNSFADIVRELDYPRPRKGYRDPLTLLAKLNLPIYITTSPYDFLEQAIIADQREPRTQICFWAGKPVKYLEESHKTDYNFVPTSENPLVYHVFGLEAYPESMVLNEDDYLDFLVRITRNTTEQKEPLLPWYVHQALTQSSLLLLGYKLHNWDFRVLFRGLIKNPRGSLRSEGLREPKFSLAIQLDPHQQYPNISKSEIHEYLEKYFNSSNFSVKLNSVDRFVTTLYEKWEQWQR